MSEKTRRLFISDVHLGGHEKSAWFKPTEHEHLLLTFFDYVARQKNVKDLVLLGDIFDTWMWPMDHVPEPLVALVAKRHPAVVAALQAARGAVENIFYINGNHDMDVRQAELDAIFGANVVTWIPAYHAGLLYAEHGSRFAMFNAPDKMHDPKGALPLGYFITRLLAGTAVEYHRPGALAGFIDDALESLFTSQTIAESVIEALMELTGRSPGDVFKMPARRTPEISIAQVQKKYAPLFMRWSDKFGPRYTVNSVRAEIGSLGYFADLLCKKQGYKVVVLGHTHDAELDKDSLGVPDRVYANTGFWCPQRTELASFVEVDKKDGKYTVRTWTCGDKVAQTAEVLVPDRPSRM